MKETFEMGDIVYLKTDPEQLERMVVGLNIREAGTCYAVVFGVVESYHYGFEMTHDRDIMKVTTN